VNEKEFYTDHDDKVCIYCNHMDGKTADLDENFVEKGDSLTVDGKTIKFSYDDVLTCPLHNGCRCTLYYQPGASRGPC
jgi:hypothetical protein